MFAVSAVAELKDSSAQAVVDRFPSDKIIRLEHEETILGRCACKVVFSVFVDNCRVGKGDVFGLGLCGPGGVAAFLASDSCYS